MSPRVASLVAGGMVAAFGFAGCSSDAEPEAVPQSAPPATRASPSTATCEPVPPQRLPSGAAAGTAQSQGDRRFIWGRDSDEVVQQVGGNPLGVSTDWPQRVDFRDAQALLVPIGDPGQIAFVFETDGCTYTTWLAPGFTVDEAREYISSY